MAKFYTYLYENWWDRRDRRDWRDRRNGRNKEKEEIE